MGSQNNASQQYDKLHAVTITATDRVEARRFIAYDGAHADGQDNPRDALGVAEFGADAGQAVTAITAYSALVEVSEPVKQFAFVRPAADGSGRAEMGDATDHAGRALGDALAEGDIIEVQVLPHVHA